MGQHLYIVTATFRMCVLAANEDTARATAREHALDDARNSEEGDFYVVEVERISRLTQVPRCLRDTLPWTDNEDELDDDYTVRQILIGKGAS